jgi:hypothetical protein
VVDTHTAVFRENGLARSCFDLIEHGPCYQYSFVADGKQVAVLAPRSSEALSEICDVVLRLLAASVVRSVLILKGTHEEHFINGPTLAYMMEQCQSLKTLTLMQIALNEDHCRALGAYSRSGLEIELKSCKLTSTGTSAFVEMLGRNEGPTMLDHCDIDNFVLANGLHGNSRLKTLRLFVSGSRDDNDQQGFVIASALRENKGLVDLKIRYDPSVAGFAISDETWNAVCDSLKTHPTLEVLDVWRNRAASPRSSWIQALVDMMQVNVSIHTLRLPNCYSGHVILGSVVPYLETNRLRPRVRAIQKTRPMTYRVKVLGRALLSTRSDANSFWMLLSENAEVVFPSRITTIAAAANLPTPATTAATSTSIAVAIATSVVSAMTTTATGSLPTDAAATTLSTASDACAFTVAATASVATPSARQKRKAHP